MKKIIYSMMALAMTTTVFTSCEDVPAPYSVTFEENNNNNTNTPTTPTAGTGTEADPFNVAAALKYIDAGQNLDKDVYVSGTIVSVKEIDAAPIFCLFYPKYFMSTRAFPLSRIFSIAFSRIWRTRSRVRPISVPISSKPFSWQPIPKHSVTIFISRSFKVF